tara:strand:+ start:30185 stop:31654 length:1470 start_codon:yes stop_codon:yes gene_type:complete
MARAGYYLLTLFFFVHLSCTKKNKFNSPDTSVLAVVRDRIITVNDFIKRCEYVPRPAYCKGENYIHKKIAMNSLIAEKILAIEFEKMQLSLNEPQINLIEGRKEQAMRQLMLKTYGYDFVEEDKNKIELLMLLRSRIYETSFLTIHKEKQIALSKVEKIFNKEESLNSNNTIKSKVLRFNDEMIQPVKELLFYDGPKKNKIFGPYNIDSTNLYLNIKGWTASVIVTQKEKNDAWESAKKDFVEKEALNFYSSYVSKLLKNKEINFYKESFNRFASRVSDIYMIEKKEKEKVLQDAVWEQNGELKLENLSQLDNLKSEIIFSHEDKSWAVSDLMELIKKHPLVFRNKKFHPQQFNAELKLSIADLIRDMHITKRAYDLGLDKDVNIIQVKQKWEDYQRSALVKLHYLKKIPNLDNIYNNKFPENFLVKAIDSLQKIYSNDIKINTDELGNIKLSKIDLFARYSNQAYVNLEPSFPILTDDHLFDYGSILK